LLESFSINQNVGSTPLPYKVKHTYNVQTDNVQTDKLRQYKTMTAVIVIKLEYFSGAFDTGKCANTVKLIINAPGVY